MYPTLQPWIKTGTIPAGLKATAQLKVQQRILNLHSVVFANETRPLADPRPCFAQVIRAGAEAGAIFAVGSCSGYNDFAKVIPQPFMVGKEDIVDLTIYGDLGDVWKMKLMYSVVKLGR